MTSLSTQHHLRHVLLWIFQHPLYSPRSSEKQDVQIKLATFYFNHVKSISICAGSFPVFDLLALLNLELGLVAAVEIKLKLKILQAEHRQVQVINPELRNKGLDCCRGLFRCLPLLKCVFLNSGEVWNIPTERKVIFSYYDFQIHSFSQPQSVNNELRSLLRRFRRLTLRGCSWLLSLQSWGWRRSWGKRNCWLRD